MVPEAWF